MPVGAPDTLAAITGLVNCWVAGPRRLQDLAETMAPKRRGTITVTVDDDQMICGRRYSDESKHSCING